MRLTDTIEGYRIGWRSAGFRRRDHSDRFKPFHRPWQAEASGDGALRFARRSLTKRGAERKMKRDWWLLATDGRLSLFQRWKLFTRRGYDARARQAELERLRRIEEAARAHVRALAENRTGPGEEWKTLVDALKAGLAHE